MNWSVGVFAPILLLGAVGCQNGGSAKAPAAAAPTPAAPTQSPSPAPAPAPTESAISLGPGDQITYGVGGGEMGAAYTNLAVAGSGQVTLVDGPDQLDFSKAQPRTEWTLKLTGAEVQALVNDLGEAGIWDLSGTVAGDDQDGWRISTRIGEAKTSLFGPALTPDKTAVEPRWVAVDARFRRLIARVKADGKLGPG